MADEKGFELKVGLFVAIGIVIFFIIVFSIGDVKFVKTGYKFFATFNFVNGITESAPVRLAGVRVGYVEKMRVYYDENAKQTKVELVVSITSDKIKIEKDSKATINTLGLLGEKYLEIFPGTYDGGFIEKGDMIVGEDPVVMQSLTGTMRHMAESVDSVMTNLKEGKGTIGKLLTDETVYNDLEDFVADIKAHPWKLLKKN